MALIVFAIASALGIGVLATPWFAWTPLLPTVRWLARQDWFFVVEAALLAITAVGLLATLIRAIATPSKRAQLTIKRDHGSVHIAQSALRSTVRHVIANHRGLTADAVRTRITGSRNPRVSVQVIVFPGHSSELGKLGAQLQTEIAATLEAFTGRPVDSVSVTFSGEADVVTPAFTSHATQQTRDAHAPRTTLPASASPAE